MLYGADHKLIKKIGSKKTDFGTERLNLVKDYYSYKISNDKIYTINSAGETTIESFDKNGEFLKKIKLPLDRVKMDSALQEKVQSEVKEDMIKMGQWENFKKRLYFPPSAPALNYFNVYEGKIVARTYRYKGKEAEFVIFNLNSKELKRKYLYDSGRTSNGTPFCFEGNYFYHIQENVDEEVWELYREKL